MVGNATSTSEAMPTKGRSLSEGEQDIYHTRPLARLGNRFRPSVFTGCLLQQERLDGCPCRHALSFIRLYLDPWVQSHATKQGGSFKTPKKHLPRVRHNHARRAFVSLVLGVIWPIFSVHASSVYEFVYDNPVMT